MQCFVVLMSTFIEIMHKEQLGKKEKMNFQNSVNSVTETQTKLELVFLYFHLKEVQNQDVFLFWLICIFILFQTRNVRSPMLSVFPLPRDRDPAKGRTEPST